MALGIGGTSRPIPDKLSPSEFARLFRLTPHKAIAALQRRSTAVTTLSWAELWQSEHSRQFTISRLTRLDLVKDFHKAILDSVQGDLSRRDYMRDMQALLEKSGWWGKKEVIDKTTGEVLKTRFDSRRLRLIYDVNTRQANASGRWERIQEAKHSHPYLRYVTRNDEKVRHAHREWHNLTLPVDHPFWNTHFPPCGWRCRCTTRALSQRDYDKGKDPFGEPLKTTAPEVKYREWKHKQTGRIEQVPVGIDPGWGYNVGDQAQSGSNLTQLANQKIQQMPPALQPAARTVVGQPAPAPAAPPVTIDDFIREGKAISAMLPDVALDPDKFLEKLLEKLEADVGISTPAAVKSSGAGAKLVKEASRRYPDTWTAAADAFGPLYAMTNAKTRGYYRTTNFPNWPHAKVKLPDFGTVKYEVDAGYLMIRKGDVGNAVHEYAHRLQVALPDLDDLFQQVHRRRTAGDPLEQLSKLEPLAGYGPSEVVRKDNYTLAYQGREYTGGVSGGAQEVMTMAFEHVLGLTQGHRLSAYRNRNLKKFYTDDKELFDFTIGLLFKWKP